MMMGDGGELVVSGRFGSWGLRAWGLGGLGVEVGDGWRMEEGVFRVVRVIRYSIY